MRIKSQLTSPTVAVDRNVSNSSMDAINAVNAQIEAIEAIGTEEALANIATVAGLDFDDILTSVDVLDNLTVEAYSTSSTTPEAELIGSVLRIGIPVAQNGIDGLNGMTPIPTFAYNSETGYLTVEVNEYANINTGTTTIVESGTIDLDELKEDIIEEINESEEW